ncbi:M48 family peptidase [Breoghania sp. L-A4]|nr:M48 family peptidase [Breoghania sp. L-A4]
MVMGLQAACLPALAQGRKLPLVRDAETETLLRDYARPILKAAGLAGDSVDVILINDKRFNAFVVDGRRIFINTGVIMDAKTPNEVIGVLAHETGHIAGNHMARLRTAAARAQIMAVIGALLGAGVMAAGASAGSGGVAQGGAAIAGAGGGIAQRSLLAYQRTEEASADRAAVTYLDRTGQSAKGMVTTFERFADQQLFSAQYTDPYVQSHPMARERLSQLENLAKRSKNFGKKDSPALQARHDLVRAKLLAFTSHPQTVFRAYGEKDRSLPAEYARAVVKMRSGNPRDADRAIDALIAKQPNNPYFWELKGQARLESGKPREAVAPFAKAVSLAPNEGLLHIWHGYALVASGDNGALRAAVQSLTKGLQREPNSPLGYAQLAIAEARLGDTAAADLATAQSMMAGGDFDNARRYAARAQQKLKRGSPQWLQADDIVSYKPPKF